MAKTPLRNFRISDDVYLPALEKAKSEGVSLSDIVRDALIEYVEGYEDED
ncbi:putative CopG family antitoxin [Microbacterium trichothecenolyticum]|nr:ribbon-helix-helix protein, CopG family [Microbacterium trichothecenolyticum]MDR7113926.1 putative CopG family antitoxin [Microbacterium trichothecenolyticum]